MFSRPVSSRLKPTPSESSGVTRPHTVTRPAVGGRMPGDRAQHRRLARAVAADHAVDRAGRHLEADAAQRLDHHRPLRAVAQARERALQRLVLLARDAEADPEVVDPDGRRAVRGGQQSHAPAPGTRPRRRRRSRAPTPTPRAGSPATATAPVKICSSAANDGYSGFQRRYTSSFGGISHDEVEHRRDVQPDPGDVRQEAAGVAVEHHERREQQAETEGHDGQDRR